jgi:hypothetical protein
MNDKVNRTWQMITILIWIFSLGVAYATISSRVSNNEAAIVVLVESVKTNRDCVESIKKDRGSLSNDMQEIKFNMKSICKALKIDYITTKSE